MARDVCNLHEGVTDLLTSKQEYLKFHFFPSYPTFLSLLSYISFCASNLIDTFLLQSVFRFWGGVYPGRTGSLPRCIHTLGSNMLTFPNVEIAIALGSEDELNYRFSISVECSGVSRISQRGRPRGGGNPRELGDLGHVPQLPLR